VKRVTNPCQGGKPLQGKSIIPPDDLPEWRSHSFYLHGTTSVPG
jgi:hypothetical protein